MPITDVTPNPGGGHCLTPLASHLHLHSTTIIFQLVLLQHQYHHLRDSHPDEVQRAKTASTIRGHKSRRP